ncbi:flagellar basal body L-ring protein FlgH [Paraneptunicella aestuarii]|uniref:flagellar basal body L-ring protein FlgH n=1 Tax=Paraneptunicella aestuarii TaxID=2831148 RepID=UPI001E2F90C2|nr:flagellar basal body L-ring protein FlgH [Paraneptunicella aestuarii]UAA39479.1 flagellar basal body L-ring protein FlgH [Paraneptunicella aestuarii]
MRSLVKTVSITLCSVGMLSGCMSTAHHEPMPNDPFYAPIIPDMPSEKVNDDGSIFQASMSSSLYSDAKARRIGDIITVILRENTTATKSAKTTMGRDNAMTVEPIIGLGGQNVTVGNQSIQMDLNTSNSFEGDAQANQSNNLNGNISVTVVQVLPNSNLVIRGEKWLTLNSGDEYLRLTGIVRPSDINPANEVLSTKIANARIKYSGTGEFARTQEQGWLTKFFSSSWWPF